MPVVDHVETDQSGEHANVGLSQATSRQEALFGEKLLCLRQIRKITNSSPQIYNYN